MCWDWVSCIKCHMHGNEKSSELKNSPSRVQLSPALHLLLLWCTPEYRGFAQILSGKKPTWSIYLGSSWAIAVAVAGAISLRRSMMLDLSMKLTFETFTLVWQLHSCRRQWQATWGQETTEVGSSTHLVVIMRISLRGLLSRERHLWQELSQMVRGGWERCPGGSRVTLEHIWGVLIEDWEVKSEED